MLLRVWGAVQTTAGKHNPSTVFIWLMKAYFFCNIFRISINQLGRQLCSKIRMFLLPHLISFSPTALFPDTIRTSAPSVFPFSPLSGFFLSDCKIPPFIYHRLLSLSPFPPANLFFFSHTLSLILVFIRLSLVHLRSVYPVWFYLHQNEGTRTGTGSPSQRHSPHGCLYLISSFKDFSLLIFLPGRGCSFLGYLLMFPAFIFSPFFVHCD